MAVCIVGSLLYIFKCCRSLNLVLADRIVIFACCAVFVCRDYIIVTGSTVCFTGKDHSCFIADNFDITDHCLANYRSIFDNVEFNSLAASVVLVGRKCFDCYSTFADFFVCTVGYFVIFTFCQFYRTVYYSDCRFNLLACYCLICDWADCCLRQIKGCNVEFYSSNTVGKNIVLFTSFSKLNLCFSRTYICATFSDCNFIISSFY